MIHTFVGYATPCVRRRASENQEDWKKGRTAEGGKNQKVKKGKKHKRRPESGTKLKSQLTLTVKERPEDRKEK